MCAKDHVSAVVGKNPAVSQNRSIDAAKTSNLGTVLPPAEVVFLVDKKCICSFCLCYLFIFFRARELCDTVTP